MPAKLIDGNAVASGILDRLRQAVDALGARKPSIAAVLVGDNPASRIYVSSKMKRADQCGIVAIERSLPGNACEDDVKGEVQALSADPNIDGVIVQLPLPKHINPRAVIEAIDPRKDVDGLTEANVARLALGLPGLRPCTPKGCVALAASVHSELAGAHVAIVGRSMLVGRPAAQMFLQLDCTVTLAHSKSGDLPSACRSADVLVVAAGSPRLVQGSWIRPGATVIDVGINRASSGNRSHLVGDVCFAEAVEIAGAITPVPGGVGPMTIACLLENTLLAYETRQARALFT